MAGGVFRALPPRDSGGGQAVMENVLEKNGTYRR